MKRWFALALLVALPVAAQDRFPRCRSAQGRSDRGFACDQAPFFEFAPASGAGLGAPCACAAVTGAKGETIAFTRTGVAECYSNDGQTLTQCGSGLPRVSSGMITRSTLGIWAETNGTNEALQGRDLSQAVWTKTNMTCALTATGMRGAANSASTCTATAANATVCQAIVSAASRRSFSGHIKRLVGTGAVTFSMDAVTYFAPTSGSLSSSLFRRWVPHEVPGCAGGNCILVPQLVGVAASTNPTVCIKLATSGDSVAIDFVQEEPQEPASSPILTGAASATRGVEGITTDLGASVPLLVGSLEWGYTVVGLGNTATSGAPMFVASNTGINDLSGLNQVRSWNYYVSLAGQSDCLVGNNATFTTTMVPVGFSTPIGRTWCFTSSGTVNGRASVNAMTAATQAGPFSAPRYLTIGGIGSFTGNNVISEVCLGANGCAKADPNLPGTATDIVWVGDSIISGHFSVPGTPPVQLSSLTGRKVIQGGVGGAVIIPAGPPHQNCGDSLNYALANSQAHTIVFSCGINDLALTTGAAMATAAKALLQPAVTAGRRVIVTGITPFGSSGGWTAGKETERQAYNTAMLGWAPTGSGTYAYASTDSLGTGSPLALLAAYDGGDGTHLLEAGALALATVVNGAAP